MKKFNVRKYRSEIIDEIRSLVKANNNEINFTDIWEGKLNEEYLFEDASYELVRVEVENCYDSSIVINVYGLYYDEKRDHLELITYEDDYVTDDCCELNNIADVIHIEDLVSLYEFLCRYLKVE